MARSTLFLLHGLALSGRSWDGVVAALGDGIECVALDLPGHGANAGSPLITLEEAVREVAEQIRRREPDRWLIAGSGTGGRIATLVAARAERGRHGLTPAAGLAVVGAVPVGPVPVTDDRAERMRRCWADGPPSAADAAAYLDGQLTGPIPDAVRAIAVADVRRAARVAVLEWLERGGLEDRSDEMGALRTPAVVIVGEQDGDRPPLLDAVPGAPVHELAGAGPLAVLERPAEVAGHLAALEAQVRDRARVPAAFARLIASDRVAERTRRVMLDRLAEPIEGAPRALSSAQRELLTAVLARVLPQRGTEIDLAGRIDADLAAGRGDGWRFAQLPPDAEAWRRGLDTLAALEPGFAGSGAQDAVLDRIADGGLGSERDGLLTGPQMALWFSDVRAAAVRTWLSHPAAQAWIRYDGFADGGDDDRKQGFATTHAGTWEPWQRDWRTGQELRA